jgi:hypothetical protein
MWRDTLEGKFERLAGGLGIKRGLTRPGVYELARPPSSRLSAPLSPVQSLLPNISFKSAHAAGCSDDRKVFRRQQLCGNLSVLPGRWIRVLDARFSSCQFLL